MVINGFDYQVISGGPFRAGNGEIVRFGLAIRVAFALPHSLVQLLTHLIDARKVLT